MATQINFLKDNYFFIFRDVFFTRCALIQWNIRSNMVKVILVGIILALVYSQPNLRLTIADWLNNVSDFLTESVENKQEDYKKLRFKTNDSLKNNWEYRFVEENKIIKVNLSQ